MKKLLLIFILLLLISCGNSNYLVHQEKGIKLFQNSSKEISIIDVDLNNAGVSFGMVNSSTGKIFIDYEKSTSKKDRFYRFYPKDLSVGKNNKVFAMVNGQFFNAEKNPTFLSFPLKSAGKIINSYVDNDLAKRTIIIDKNENLKIIEGYDEKDLFNTNNKELIVAFNPSVDSSIDSKVGRSYIGIKGDKNIIFFIAKNKTQLEMDQLITEYGITKNNVIMMDGGPSAQFSYFNNGLNSFYGKWAVPQYNIIYNK
ncbi:MAG: phosphodiester glycosidase family protein [Candidatus Gracilibacteria bacterium]|nr:phosphodiester glycosidase family protein [Candidatus Gracilibacteria bacterium]